LSDSETALQTGDMVITTHDHYPISTGRVEFVSQCGRYAIVRKWYGERRTWRRPYKMNELEKVDNS
jgi:hypothetical protein